MATNSILHVLLNECYHKKIISEDASLQNNKWNKIKLHGITFCLETFRLLSLLKLKIKSISKTTLMLEKFSTTPLH